jgi:quinol monooxygenase YgiN
MVISTLRILTARRSRAVVVRGLVAYLGLTRVQPGCLRCDLYQDIEDRETITLVEEWESEADLRLRLGSDASRAILGAIELSPEHPVLHVDTVLSRAGLEVIESARGLRREAAR